MAPAGADARPRRGKGRTWATLAALALSFLACSHDWTVRPRAAALADADTDGPDGPTTGDGGDGTGVLTELASGEEGAAELVVVRETLLWTIDAPSTGTIRACDVSDCRPRPLAGAQDVPHSLIVEDPHVMWLVGKEIRRTDLQGAPVTVVASIDKPLQAVRRIGDRLYASDPDFVARCNFNQVSAVCTGRSTIGPDFPPSSLGPLTVDPLRRLWTASRETLYWLDLDVDRRRTWAPVERARSLVASEAAVFALLEKGDVVAVPTTAADGGAPRSVRVDGTASAIAVDRTHLFVGYKEGRVDRHALSAIDQRETVASGLGDVKALAVDRDRIYVALADGRIGAVPQPSAGR